MLALGQYLLRENVYHVRLGLKLVSGFEMSKPLLDILQASGIEFSVIQRASKQLWRSIANADLVHAQNASPDIALIAKLCSTKLVQTIHNHLLDRGMARTLSWRFGASLSQWRTYNSRFVQETWESKPCSKSEVIPTVSELNMDFAPLPPRCGFIFISRLIPNKGANMLIEAYQTANIDRDTWPLQLIGDGPMRSELEELRQKAPKGIQLRGFITDSEKQTALRSAKWLVAPPNTREDMGLTPLEARANGIPTIATRDGGLPESAGKHALFCTPGDVNSLRIQLEHASQMSDAEYTMRAKGCFDTLADHLKPLSYYSELYQRLLS